MNNKIKEIITLESLSEHKGKRLDVLINEILEDSTRSYVQKLIASNLVEISGVIPKKNGYKIRGNEIININIPENEEIDLTPEDIPIEIVYEDSHIVIINKQAGIVVHPAYGNYNGTLVNALLYHIKDLSGINGMIRPGIVHRLDKNTSGLIIVAKEDNSHVKLSHMFANKEIKKTYIAISKGILKDKDGQIESLIGRDPKERKRMAVVKENGKNAITNYHVLDEKNNVSLISLNIETGRTHQIRVHLKSLGHPIVGDETYGNKSDIFTRQMLHAYKLEFIHPITSEKLEFIGELPKDFKKCLKHFNLGINNLLT